MFVQTAGRCPKTKEIIRIFLMRGKYCLVIGIWYLNNVNSYYAVWRKGRTSHGYHTLRQALQAFQKYRLYHRPNLLTRLHWLKEGF